MTFKKTNYANDKNSHFFKIVNTFKIKIEKQM